MNDARCVVAAVDFSASARCALDLAAALCRRADLPLLLLHVWNPNQLAGPGVLSPPLDSWIEQHRAKLLTRLEAWVDEMRGAGCESSGRVEVGVAFRGNFINSPSYGALFTVGVAAE